MSKQKLLSRYEFERDILPELSQKAQDFLNTWREDLSSKNDLSWTEATTTVYLRALQVLQDVANARKANIHLNCDHWSDNQCVFYLNATIADRSLLS